MGATVLAHELTVRGHEIERQVPIVVRYDELVLNLGLLSSFGEVWMDNGITRLCEYRTE